MFESKGKHELQQKQNKLKGLSSASTRFSFNPDKAAGTQSVYSELKLSEHLASQLQLVRDQVDDLNEKLETALYKNKQLEQ